MYFIYRVAYKKRDVKFTAVEIGCVKGVKEVS